jgi:hypothetical protein
VFILVLLMFHFELRSVKHGGTLLVDKKRFVQPYGVAMFHSGWDGVGSNTEERGNKMNYSMKQALIYQRHPLGMGTGMQTIPF